MTMRGVVVQMEVWTALEIEEALVMELVDRGGKRIDEINAIYKGVLKRLQGGK